MKRALFYFYLLATYNGAIAISYYVDATNGNDSNNGLTTGQAWQSVERVNSANLIAGDSVLFKRGEIFRGNLIPQSGSASGNITYSAYGTGNKPKLYGSVQKKSMADWVNEGGNIWHSRPNALYTGAELLSNPDFNADASGWYAWSNATNGASTNLSRTTVPGEYYIAPGGGKLVCTNQGTTLTDIQLMSDNPISISLGKWYKFTFKAKTSQQFLIPPGNIKLIQNVAPYTLYSLSSSNQSLIAPSWATYEVFFKSTATATDARVCIYLGSIIPNGTTFYFDSISFKELDGDPGIISADAGNIIFNNESSCGIKVKSDSELNAQGKFCYDADNLSVKMYSVSNPALFYSNIEIALTKLLIDESNKSYITYENLDLRYGAAHGIGGINTHHITIKDMDFSWIGGGYQPDLADVRYGNGVEFWCAAHDNVVERCKLNQVYDAALTAQGFGSAYEAYNIFFRNNIVMNSEYSYEFWGYPETTYLHDIYFENNTCLYAGYGWGHSQRPDPNGTHFMIFGLSLDKVDNVYIRNNIFYESSEYSARYNDPAAINKITVDDNCWYESSGSLALIANIHYNYTTQQDAFQSASGLDVHSTYKNPLLNSDYTLSDNSPCINSGISTAEVIEDFNRTPRPQGDKHDKGAFEFPCIGTVPDQPVTISGDIHPCQGEIVTYSVAAITGAYYTWTLPSGWQGESNTHSITAQVGTTGGNITVTANNGCGSSAPRTLGVIANPIPAAPVITLNNSALQSNAPNGNQWFLNNNPISGAVNDTYIPTVEGNYYVMVTVNGCTSQQSNVIEFVHTQVNETITRNGISLYPNPTTGTVKIILDDTFGSDYTVFIYNNVGILFQTLKKGKSEINFDLDLGKYPKGIYLIRIYTSEKYYQSTIVKE